MTNENINTPAIIPDTPIVTESDLEQALIVAERTEKLVRKIKVLAIKQTNPRDWVDTGDAPYLQGSGAEKIAALFGINWRICEGYPLEEHKSDEKGSYYYYTVKGVASMGKREIDAIGVCSQRDKFFGKNGSEFKSESEIDVANIIRKAVTNMEVNGIKRLLGIRNITWDDLAEAGIKRESLSSVNYKTKAGESSEVEGPITSGTTKSGNKGGKAWKLYEITVNNIRMSTFDSKLGEAAAEAKKNGQQVHVTYKNDGKGNKIESLEVITIEEPQAEAADYE